ncbi:unnamed protein product [Sphagnum troendelagicum]
MGNLAVRRNCTNTAQRKGRFKPSYRTICSSAMGIGSNFRKRRPFYPTLLMLLMVTNQHNAAFALYGLADNEDNVSDIVKEGGVQRLFDGELIVQVVLWCLPACVYKKIVLDPFSF